jgi:HNH endonuclease
MFGRICSFEGCGKPLLAKGYCSAPCRFNELPRVRSGEWESCTAARSTGGWCAGHAAQWYEKRPLKPLRRRRTACDFPGCPNRHSSRGYCAAHYRQLQRGKPLTPLSQRKGWFKAGSGYVYLWEPDHPNANKHGYVAEHTKVMAAILGRPLLRGEEVHHRNRKRDDNRPENLEIWARGQQPPGARVSDLVDEAVRILRLYAPEKLSEPP